MSDDKSPMHYVSTREELKAIADRQTRFWVSNCGCREGREGGCKRSRMDVCLMFAPVEGSSGTNKRVISRAEMEAIFREAEEKHLVTRPFRSEDRRTVEGSCFCCDDCCGYFQTSEYQCDKGQMIELTDPRECTDCGACVDVCHFKARRMVDGKLVLERDKCFGCGLCRDVCAVNCIKMVPRA
jgi:Pyruvate/2-oxoacid:ferredoxin oxidoreductase delta subunit